MSEHKLECCGNCKNAFMDYDGFACKKFFDFGGESRSDDKPILPWTVGCEHWEFRGTE